MIALAAGVGAVSAVLLAASAFWGHVFFGSASHAILVLALPVLLAGGGLHSIAYGYFRGLPRLQAAHGLIAINMGLPPLGALPLFPGSVGSIPHPMGVRWGVPSAAVLVRLPFGWAGIKERLRDLTRFGVPRMPGDLFSLLIFSMPGILIAQSSSLRVAGIAAFGVAAVSMIGSSLTPVSFLLLPTAARLLAAGKVRQLRTERVEVVALTPPGPL